MPFGISTPHRYGLLLGGSVLALTAFATVPAGVGSAVQPHTVAFSENSPARFWTPRGGLSSQAWTVLRRSATARTALQLYKPFETGDTSVYDTLLTEDFVDAPLAPGQGPGREGMKQHVAEDIVATFPDLTIRIEAIHVAGNTVTVRSVISGTQQRPFLGVPATHRKVSFRAVDIHQVNPERGIARTDHLEDLFGAYRQITQ
ncbi:ester cyclase [Streptomyces sp. NPDC051636]|uniref:ester cyclase n=1 Tax=Streptomyces sp. NPDC051636 TaxID=3365663 RepID=UPI0037AE6EE6